MTEPGQSLEVRPERSIEAYEDPQTVVDRASRWATVLMDIVNKRELFTMIGKKKYLEAEAWQTILSFDRACAVPEWCEPIRTITV